MRRNAPVGVVRPPRWRGWVISGGWRRRGSGRQRRLSAAEPGSGQGSDGRRCGRSRAQQVGRVWCAAHRQLLRFGSAAARSASVHATTRVQPTRATRTTVSPLRVSSPGGRCALSTHGRTARRTVEIESTPLPDRGVSRVSGVLTAFTTAHWCAFQCLGGRGLGAPAHQARPRPPWGARCWRRTAPRCTD
jgi:hypothetical protein